MQTITKIEEDTYIMKNYEFLFRAGYFAVYFMINLLNTFSMIFSNTSYKYGYTILILSSLLLFVFNKYVFKKLLFIFKKDKLEIQEIWSNKLIKKIILNYEDILDLKITEISARNGTSYYIKIITPTVEKSYYYDLFKEEAYKVVEIYNLYKNGDIDVWKFNKKQSEYKKWSFKLPLYLIIFYILHTWISCLTKDIARTDITLYLYNLPFLLIFVVVALAICSKEILLVDNNKFVIEKYFLFYLYERKIIDVLNIRSIFFAEEYEKHFPVFLPLDIVKNLKIRAKESDIEDKIYTFGVCLNEEKYKEIIGEILKYSETKGYLQKLINITNF